MAQRSPDQPTISWTLLALVGALLVLGGAGWLAGVPTGAEVLWAAATVVSLVPACYWVVRALRRGQTGVDAIAVLALAGSLAVGEYLAGAIVGLMLATGRTLEAYAERRAARDLSALVAHAPRSARRRTAEGAVEVVPLAQVSAGDRLLVAPGEVAPVDGVAEDPAVLDESVLTGESRPVERAVGEAVASGVINAGPGFGLLATATADQSTYAGIVELARAATAETAPAVRLADRYATWFLPASLLVAGLAWLLSGDPVRAVAVLVVATPCPLLLAVPIAIVAGMSRAARRGVVVRGGGTLERLGRAETLLLDKTGTLTGGRPELAETVPAPGVDGDRVLRAAAALEQLSPHVLATAIVQAAVARSLPLPVPTEVTEEPGAGIHGLVDGEPVRVGQLDGHPPPWAVALRHRAASDGSAIAWVSLDGGLAGGLRLRDPIRPDAAATVNRLRAAGLRRLIMVTGDRELVAEQVGRSVGVDEVVAGCTPADKVERVRQETRRGVTVMVGDGVNDAPALATADVGVAMGARGATVAAEVADAVMTVDELERLADTVAIAARTRRIATQSAAVGMALSLAAMAVAAFGQLPPAVGAVVQEGIDVVVILNALRALGGGWRPAASRAWRPGAPARSE
ncbi:heavy metal translocating P-type ATPase [Natronosporangium hydrolyticum]|uniref:Heavy metal translocating P-type ATPase n=1 Tax=Natronosporangium hydrolyticum TaxID=2811111 RepID=A0A895Y9X5_9ACTN|nr:heavy metal translocating P-type ATPase [Natronosporangium hydrolyticum]QSB13062.1 heavy metal translocating P-type ATPase [Natronosporangium hydrolyticum]